MDHSDIKKVVIAGGNGFVGGVLADHLSNNCQVIILSRNAAAEKANIRTVKWNARDLGEWVDEIDGADAIINLTGKNVNCRYTSANKTEILESRTLSTKVLGQAVNAMRKRPRVWLQMSSSTIYRHAEDKPMDETFGEIGDDFSMNVCKAWEKVFNELEMNGVRRVIMRTSIVMGKGGGALPAMINLVKTGLGGRQGSGNQMVSWIHEKDVVAIVDWFLYGSSSGIYNIVAPQPVPNKVLMKTLQNAYGATVALPTPEWMLKLGAIMIGTETELVLKSRWVIPKNLLQEGYRFRFPSIESAAKDLLT